MVNKLDYNDKCRQCVFTVMDAFDFYTSKRLNKFKMFWFFFTTIFYQKCSKKITSH